MARLPIYLDHHATTPLDPRVLDAMLPFYREDFGNAASVNHAYGWRAAAVVDDARERIADVLGTLPEEIVFTSGATEANNLAIQGVVRARRGKRCHLVTLTTEHPAVLDVCRALAADGHAVTEVPVDRGGLIAPDAIASAITDETVLVSVMLANNEIGVIQPLPELAAVCRDRGVSFHTDAAQAAGKLPFTFGDLGVDLLSISAHKFYGPKGIGVLVVRSGRPRVRIEPILYGGGHERGLRSGTLAVPLIVGMARALEIAREELEPEAKRVRELRDRLWAGLSAVLDVSVNGHLEQRLPGNLNVCFRDVDGDRLLLALTDVAVSSGSACTTASPGPSHVLLALGRDESEARASLRFGLGRGTTQGEIDTAVERVIRAVRQEQGHRR